MSKERFKVPTAIFGVLLRDDNEILLLRRFNTGYEDGNYSLPAGHIDGRESLSAALIREMNEELGIVIYQQDIDLALLMHRNADDGERMDVFFLIRRWTNTPQNMEPHKADNLSWFPINQLPHNTIPFILEAIEKIASKKNYSEYGWNN